MSYEVLQGRPIIESTPSGLRKITRFTKLNAEGAKAANLSTYFIAYGTADAEFTTALLIGQRIDRRSEQGIDVSLVQVYQELANNALTATTDVTESTSFDGRRVTRTTYLCKASQAASLRPAIGSGSPAVFQVDVEISGPVAKVVTSAIAITSAGFVLSTSDDTRNNGALLVRTIRTVGGAPGTPGGYTPTSTATQQVDGYTVYNYTFAKGTGQISQDDDTKNNGALLTRTIRYLTVPGTLGTTGTNPIATPGTYTLASESCAEQDGYRIWTGNYVKGDGEISRSTNTGNNGALTRVSITHLTASSVTTQPTSDPLSGGTAITTEKRDADGHRVWQVDWVKGTGEVSREMRTGNNGALLRLSISYLTAPAAAEPTPTSISGYTKFNVGKREADGHLVWSLDYAQGTGKISEDIDYSQSSDQGVTGLTRTTIRYLVVPAATVQPTTLAGSVLVGQSVSDADGHRVWTTVWAKGTGTISTEKEDKEGGYLVVYRRTALGGAPTAPTPTIGGTIVLTGQTIRKEAGFDIYSYVWAEGFGTISSDVDARSDGSLAYAVTTVTATAATPAYPGSGTGYLVKLSSRQSDGYVVTNAEYIKPPTSGLTRPVQVEFRKPGLVVAGNPPAVTPPVSLDLMGTETTTFSTTQTSSVPYKISSYASLYEAYKRKDDGLQFSKVDPLNGYLGSTSATGSNTTYRGILVDTYVVTVSGSNPTTLPTGPQTISVRCEKYITDTSGVVVWRNTVVTADVT
jgi:hypothetical protein